MQYPLVKFGMSTTDSPAPDSKLDVIAEARIRYAQKLNLKQGALVTELRAENSELRRTHKHQMDALVEMRVENERLEARLCRISIV